jgi:hypothetical protein
VLPVDGSEYGPSILSQAANRKMAAKAGKNFFMLNKSYCKDSKLLKAIPANGVFQGFSLVLSTNYCQ